MIWITNPAARIGTIIETIGRAINSHAASKSEGLKTEMKLMLMCNVRNSIKNSPVMLITSFFPIEDENMFAIYWFKLMKRKDNLKLVNNIIFGYFCLLHSFTEAA